MSPQKCPLCASGAETDHPAGITEREEQRFLLLFLCQEVSKCRLISKDEKSMSLLELFYNYINYYAKFVWHTTSKITFDRYVLTRKHLMEYMEAEYGRSDISVNEVNPKFVNGFEIFLRSQFNLSTNYVMKTILKFKSVYQVAIDNGWAQKNPFANFKFHYEHAERLKEQRPFGVPAVFVEFRPIVWGQSGAGSKYADVEVRLHILTATLATPNSPYKDAALYRLHLIRAIEQAFVGFAGITKDGTRSFGTFVHLERCILF